jgi:hypothetical protein
VNRPEIIDMLHWIIEKEGTPTAPGHGEIYRQEKGQTRGAALPARE